MTSPASSSDWLYVIQPVGILPSVDVTHTLAGAIVGRRRARSVDQWVIHTASRYSTLWHVMGIAFITTCLFVYFVKTTLQKTLVSTALVVFIGPVLWIHSASLCWDMLLLLLQTYEFWFIQLVNLIDFIVWILLFHDIRIVAVLAIGPSCVLSVFLDANLHMRAIVLRLLVLGSPVIVVAVALTTLRLVPDFRRTLVYIGDVPLDLVDVLTSGSFTIGYFFLMRLVLYRRQILSPLSRNVVSPATDTIRCGLYFPDCQLVPYDAWPTMRRRDVARAPPVQRLNVSATQLEIVDRDQLGIIDATETIGGVRLSYNTQGRLWRSFMMLVNAAGIFGAASPLSYSLYHVFHPADEAPRAYVSVTVVNTLLFLLIHLVHCQQALLRRVLFEIDAWFISIQATIVSLGACDAFMWDQRSLLVAVVWLWCHWMIFLDALPPVTRRRLALSRWFILFVNVVLLLCPLWLVYALFFSANKHTLRNRVILHTKIAHVEMRTEMLSFITSRIFTLWLWMGRFLWRESFRPHDAFKLIKHRVHFAVQRE